MNLVLIGYRGTGKSTIARLAGLRLRRPVLSLDAEIARREGKTIPEIVEERGWSGFRDIETAVAVEAAADDNQVLDCGGGVVLRPENATALRANGYVVWLTAPIEVIAERITGDTNRPSLTGKPITEEIREVLAERSPLYRVAAHVCIDTGNESPEACADQIAELFLAFSTKHVALDGLSVAAGGSVRTGRVAVAIYDGSCKLCRGFASILRKAISPLLLDVVACGTPIQQKLAPEVTPKICLTAFTLVEPDGRVLTGADAVAVVAAISPKVASYRWMIESAPGNWLARALYGIVRVFRGRRGCRGCGKGRV